MVGERNPHELENVVALRILQVGLGGWGRNWAVNVLKGAQGARLVAAVDASPEALALYRKDVPLPDAACFTTLDAALEAVDVDAVLITASLAGHVPLAK